MEKIISELTRKLDKQKIGYKIINHYEVAFMIYRLMRWKNILQFLKRERQLRILKYKNGIEMYSINYDFGNVNN